MTHLTEPRNFSPGIAEVLGLALLPWFDTLQHPTAPFLEAGDETTIYSTHTFVTGLLGFMKLQLAPRKNSLTAKAIGELMGQQLEFELVVFIPGSYLEQHSLMTRLLNKPLIAIIGDCGTNYQVGSRCKPAYIKHQFTTGTDKDGQKGYLATITCTGDAVIIYKGSVTRFIAKYINNGYPVLYKGLDQTVDNSSMFNMRQQFVAVHNENIVSIYNEIIANLDEKEFFIHYRDDHGHVVDISIVNKDLSTFTNFINEILTCLPAGRVLNMYGTKLLVEDAGSEEHYLAIELLDFQYLTDEDGTLVTDSNSDTLLLA